MTGLEIAELLGNLGDFLGAIAVFGTIIYLAVQVKHSKEAVEANTRALDEQRRMVAAQSSRELDLYLGTYNLESARDPELQRIYQLVLDTKTPENLAPGEYAKLRNYVMSLFFSFQAQYRSMRSDVDDKETSDQFLKNFKAMIEGIPVYKLVWDREQASFVDGFREAVEQVHEYPRFDLETNTWAT